MSIVRLLDGGMYDVDAVMSVMLDSFDPAFGEAWTAPQFAGLLPMPGVWLTIAEADGAPAGFALSRIVADEAELLLLAVKHGCQRRGIGKSLLECFVEKACSKGARNLHLEVRDGNKAVKLYERFGFEEAGRRSKYYTGRDGEMFDAITLLRKI
jgi:[ribosomal protein S18]-alanine N-acetyltransferase